MKYITVTSANGRSFYLAKERIGGGYSTIATFTNEQLAKDTAALLNTSLDTEPKSAKVQLLKGARR